MSEYEIEASDRVGVQDICGPADAPALAISQEDSEALKEAIAASGGGTIKVVLNADSQVTKDATSHNVWGEIPGKIDETIFVFAHMDGYFHSQYDDAQGLGVSLAIAKAIIDIGYEPEKTIRFCFHGAEEWGASGNEYDWSIGAYEEIATNHPEWVDGAFAIVNNDGGYVVEGETYMGTRSAVELMSFIKESIGELNSNSDYEWSYKKTSTYTEDFYWSRLGVPAIVAGSGEGEIYNNTGYHSNYDSWEYQPLDETGLKESIKTFGKLVLDLDNCFVRPMDFTARLKDFEESLNDPKDFETLFSDAYEAASAIEEKMASVEASGNQEAALELNKHTQEIYIAFQNALLGLDFESEATIKHEVYQSNIEALENAIEKLNNGEIQEAFDEYIVDVDWAWYYMNFDFETCRYLENQLFENRDDTWGEGLVLYRPCDIGEVVKALGSKYDTVNADVSQEIAKLEELLSIEQQRLEQVLGDEKKGIELVINLMNQYAK
ncbi:MAG TPA: M20/M25/M40 family metallo-hydrolase [Anaerovoracaceae bacterium]|nr:M20/M25/M40 family metallo-hydrolase [Anaerovoracaceae bacterium]